MINKINFKSIIKMIDKTLLEIPVYSYRMYTGTSSPGMKYIPVTNS